MHSHAWCVEGNKYGIYLDPKPGGLCCRKVIPLNCFGCCISKKTMLWLHAEEVSQNVLFSCSKICSTSLILFTSFSILMCCSSLIIPVCGYTSRFVAYVRIHSLSKINSSKVFLFRFKCMLAVQILSVYSCLLPRCSSVLIRKYRYWITGLTWTKCHCDSSQRVLDPSAHFWYVYKSCNVRQLLNWQPFLNCGRIVGCLLRN